MRITLLGFTFPEDEMQAIWGADAVMSIQTHTFAWSLVDALRSAGADVRLISAAPVSNFPGYPQKVFRGGRFRVGTVEGDRLPFVNLLVLKHLTRFASCLGRGTRLLRRDRPDVLLVHSVHSPFLWYGVIARRLVGTRTVIVITDPPGFVLPTDSAAVRRLKATDSLLIRRALRSVDGVVVLTSALATDFAPAVPSLLMEGLLSADVSGVRERTNDAAGARLMYAGGLVPAYGVDRLVTAVRRCRDTSVRLAVFGKGPLKEWVDGQAAVDPRIEPVRFAARQEVVAEYAQVDLLVQPRPVDQGFVRYSFPSKLLEYMASGTPVLTTRLSGIPADYEPHVYWIDDDSVEGVQAAIENVLSAAPASRRAKGLAAADFARSTRSTAAQGRRLVDFLTAITDRR